MPVPPAIPPPIPPVTPATPITSVTCHGYIVEKASVSENRLSRIRADLVAQPLSSSSKYPAPPPFRTYQESSKFLRLPRAYGVDHFGPPINDGLPDRPIGPFAFAGALKDTQIGPQRTLLEHLRGSSPYGLFSLQTGSGKTVVAISVIAALGQRTCILVHKQQLLNQWMSEINRFLPGASVGTIIQGHKGFDQNDPKDVYIVMIQSLLRMPPNTVPSVFGLTIVDECHHIPSQSFSQTMFKVNAKYMIGLSATLQRKDGLMRTLQHHLGEVIHCEIPDRSNQPKTYVWLAHYTPYGNSYEDHPDDFSELVNMLCADEARTQLIVDKVRHVLAMPTGKRRFVLILTDRKSHARELFKRFSESHETGLMISDIPESEHADQMDKQVLVGTYGMLGEGTSIKRLNTLVLASPRKEITQAVGRIYRDVHPNDVFPIIIDISDSCLRGQARTRQSIYKQELGTNLIITARAPPDSHGHRATGHR